jgi:hypothetical protein
MRVLALGLACLLAACGASRRAWQPPPVPVGAASPAAFAVVRLSQPLSLAPSREAPTVWGVAPETLYGGTAEPTYAVVRVLGEEGDWVALETLGEPSEAHCAPDVRGLEPFRLRLFVPTSALVPVTQREVTQALDDGTRIELGRGAPLEALERDLYRVRVDGLRTVLRLTRADVGTRYLPSAPRETAPSRRALRPEVLASAVPIVGRTGRVDAALPLAFPVHAEDPRGGETRVELRPRCGRLVVRVPSHAVMDVEPTVPEPPAVVATAGPRVPAGTPVHWRDGRQAGVVTHEVVLSRELAPSGRRRCFAHALRPATPADPAPELELCFDRGSIRDPEVGPARRLDAPR